MIRTFEVNNFKCLASLKVSLKPFNVFIGPNDSGKSSCLDALHVLGRTIQQPLAEVFKGRESVANLLWKNANDHCITWQVSGTADEKEFVYSIAIPPNAARPTHEWLTVDGRQVFSLTAAEDKHSIQFAGATYVGNLRDGSTFFQASTGGGTRFQNEKALLDSVAKSISSSIKYCLEPKNLRNDSRLIPNPRLDATGENLPSVLDAIITGPDGTARPSLEKYLREAIPTLTGVSVPTNQQNNAEKTLEFVLSGTKPSATIPATLASDGALLLTAFLALAYGDTPNILLVEEPENGLHPSRLRLVVDLLKQMSTGKVGNKPRQVILTTHSPILLNFVEPEDVTIFRRKPTGETAVSSMSSIPNIKSLLNDYGVGELWFLLGEEGLLKEPA